jgi:release factor glutamine methyltransferase
VLIPRAETETVVDLALAHMKKINDSRQPLVIADVGTGSGCIAIALAIHAPASRIIASDVSHGALTIAKANAIRLKVQERIIFVCSDLLNGLRAPLDLVVANPPYVAHDEWSSLPTSVREHEPRLALCGGPGGLEIIHRLLVQALHRLAPGGTVFIEIGSSQGALALDLAYGIFPDANIKIHTDLFDNDRVLSITTSPAVCTFRMRRE